MVCNARKAAVARMAERATPLTVPAHVLTVGKASIVAKGVAKTPRHMDPIVLSSVLVTGTTLSCKCLLGPSINDVGNWERGRGQKLVKIADG